jgi:hypothetical protein
MAVTIWTTNKVPTAVAALLLRVEGIPLDV